MRTIGLIGGMSWESSAVYYRILNEATRARLGGYHSANCLLLSLDFHLVDELQRAGDWDGLGALMADASIRLERGGATCVVLATNTMHKVADRIEAVTALPILHIADATAARIRAAGLETVGLLGTRFTMEHDFYAGRLRERHGLRVLVPDAEGRRYVHDVIYDELVLGKIRDASRAGYVREIERLVSRGAQGVILGCTEIPLLIDSTDSPVPVFDTTRLHAEYAVDFALDGEPGTPREILRRTPEER